MVLRIKLRYYRAQLKYRLNGKGKTHSELAKAIKKLTRQSYTNATWSVIEVLALDHFTDALFESEFRLRLREVWPKSLSDAKRVLFAGKHKGLVRQRT